MVRSQIAEANAIRNLVYADWFGPGVLDLTSGTHMYDFMEDLAGAPAEVQFFGQLIDHS